MDNKKIAEIFHEIADILDIQGAIFFRVNAYRKAALTVENFPRDLRAVVDKNPEELTKIPGIGKDLKNKIVELVQTGKCEEHERLKKDFPRGLLEMLHLRGVGPKKVKLFYSKLKITDIKQLKGACEKGEVRELEGMGEKSEKEILTAIKEYSKFSPDRSLINEAEMEANAVVSHMKKLKEIRKIEIAGSLRRGRETIGDIDILVTVKDPEKTRKKVMQHFVDYDEVLEIVGQGDTKSSVILESGMEIDLRVVEEKSFGAALHYFTGSKDHNVKIRDIAKKKGLKVNEYGVFKGEKSIAGETEEGLFKMLGLPYIPPEIRRNDGEFEYLKKHKKLPDLIGEKDMRGDLHSHSTYSDGKNSIEVMAEAFIAKGYEYFAVTDHSSVMGVTRGMGDKEIQQQWKEIDKLKKKFKGKIEILKGSEVDILKDGSLDFGEEILKQLDIVIISAHMHNRLSAAEQTKRILRALENPYSKILAHPTGRLINKRTEMEFDMEKVIEAAVENNVALEVNANPNRLDLAEKYIRIAKEKGAKFVIDTDSHSTGNIEFMKYGVKMARRGWLSAEDVLNTKKLSDLTAYFK